MLLDLSKLHGQRQHFERVFEPSTFTPDDPDYRVAEPVALSMDVQKTGKDAYRVTGTVTTRLELVCSRCVEPFEVPVEAQFELHYVPLPEPTAKDDAEKEIDEDDLTTSFYTEGSLDVIEMLREQFQLALPMKPLCTEACRGLCPECGANLNRTTCDCKPVWEDPRLAALKGLLNRQKEN